MDIPRIGGEAPGGSGGNQHTVGQGETLAQIAKQHGVTTDSLLLANPQLKDPAKLLPGQLLQIPQQTQSAEKLASSLYPSLGFAPQDVLEQAPEGFAIGPPCSQPDIAELQGIIICQSTNQEIGLTCDALDPGKHLIPCDLLGSMGIDGPDELQGKTGIVIPNCLQFLNEVVAPCDLQGSAGNAGIVQPNCLQATQGGSLLDKPTFANRFTLGLESFGFISGHLQIQDVALSDRFQFDAIEGESKKIAMTFGDGGPRSEFQLDYKMFNFSNEGFLQIMDRNIADLFRSQSQNMIPTDQISFEWE